MISGISGGKDRADPGTSSSKFLGLSPDGRGLPLLGGLLIFFAVSQVLTVLVGRLRINLSPGLALVILLVSGLAGFDYGLRLMIGESGSPGRVALRRVKAPVVSALLIIAAAWYLLLWFLAYLLPDSSWDGLWYHNPTIHFWALAGRVHWITADYSSYWTTIIDSFWNGYPKAVELFGFILVRAVGQPRLMNSINLPWLPLGISGVFCLARLAGADVRWSAAAGLLFLLVPVNITQAPTTYVDSAAASVFISCFALTILTICRMSSDNFPRGLIPALGCGLGLALGVKGTGVAVVFLCLGLIVVSRVVACRGAPGNCSEAWRSLLSRLLLVTLIALAVGGYWYLRNYLHTGSPLHPVGFAVAGIRIFPGVLDPGSLVVPAYAPGTEEWRQLIRILFAWGQGWSLDNWKEAVTSYTSRQGGLGYLWLLAGVPAIVWTMGRAVVGRCRGNKFGRPERAITWLTLLVGLLFLIVPRNHIARFSIWIYGLGLPAFAVAAGRIVNVRNMVLRNVGRIWVAAAVAMAILEAGYVFAGQRGLRPGTYRRAGPDSGLSLKRIIDGWRDDYPAGYVWPRIEGSRLEGLVAGREAAALGGFSDAVGKNRILGHLTQGRALGERPIYFLDAETVANDPDRLREFIAGRGIRFLIWDTDLPIPRPLARRVDEWHRIDGLFYLLEFYPGPGESKR